MQKLNFSEFYLPWHLPPSGMHLHIAADDAHTEELVALVRHFRPEYRVIEFDAWDCLPYDRVSPKLDVMGARVAALVQLLNGSTKPTLIITTVAATAQRVMPKSALQGHSLVLSAGTRKPVKEIQNYLEGNAYTRASTVREAGEYAIRGGIVDLFPADAETPVRIDFFGDEIEKLQNFDPVTQLSIGAI